MTHIPYYPQYQLPAVANQQQIVIQVPPELAEDPQRLGDFTAGLQTGLQLSQQLGAQSLYPPFEGHLPEGYPVYPGVEGEFGLQTPNGFGFSLGGGLRPEGAFGSLGLNIPFGKGALSINLGGIFSRFFG